MLLSIRRRSLTAALLILPATAAAMLLYICYSYHQQRNDLKIINTRLLDQNEQARALRADIETLKQQLDDQKSRLTSHKEQTEKIEGAVAETNNELKMSRKEINSLKTAMNDWQKDYVTTLLKVEEKTDAAKDQISDLNKQYDNINEQMNSLEAQAAIDDVSGLRKEIDNLKYILSQIQGFLPAGAPSTQPFQQQAHPALAQ